MKHSIGRYLRGSQKVYRFALYGRTAAGKTCLLAALNLPQLFPHPAGCTCHRLSRLPGVSPPPGDPASWDLRHDPLAAFHAGSAKLAETEESLRRGEIPAATDKQPPYLTLYEFTCPQRGSIRVELIDYAGELTDPQLTNEDLAVLLRKHLQRMDGIIVLAEAPRPGEEHADLPEDLRKLQESFALLQGELRQGGRWHAPVALVFSKWDRRGKPRATIEEREAEVREFLLEASRPPPHRRLADALAALVTEGNFKVFAASAFGAATVVSPQAASAAREVPARPTPFASYGLEDPFLWLAQRRDTIDLAAYREQTAKPGLRQTLIRWVNPFRPDQPWRWTGAARRLSHQLPEGTPERNEVRRGLFLNPLMGLSRLASCLLLMVAAWGLAETELIDRPEHRRAAAVLNDRGASLEEQDWAENWLHTYSTADPYRHYLSRFSVLGRDEALTAWSDRLAHKDEIIWEQVQDRAGDPLAQRKLAEEYLKRYPNGRHFAEARGVLVLAEMARKEGDNESRLARLEGEYNEASAGGKQSEEFRRLLAELDRLPPNPDAESATQRERRLALRRQTADELARLAGDVREEQDRQNLAFFARIRLRFQEAKSTRDLAALEKDLEGGMPYPDRAGKEVHDERAAVQTLLAGTREKLRQREEWEAFTEKYQTALHDRQLPRAARLLLNPPRDGEELRRLKRDFRTQVVVILNRQQLEYREAGTWPRALEVLESALQDAGVVSLLEADDRRKMNDLIQSVKTGWGQQLYAELRRSKTIEDAKRYLELPVDQRMAPEVRRYRDYLDRLAGPLELTIKLTRIDWADWWNDYKNRVSVWMDAGSGAEELIYYDNIRSRKGKSTTDVGEKTVKQKVSDRIRLTVYVWNREGFSYGYRRPAGVKVWTGTLLNLRDRELELEDDEGRPSKGAKVHLDVAGIPAEPELPVWRE